MQPLTETYAGLVAATATVTDLDEDGFARPTRAAGWDVRALLFHLLLDAQRTLVALASPTDAPADVDRATYWLAFQPQDDDEEAAAHAEFVRRAAAAYDGPRGLVVQWRATATAAARAAATAVARDPHARVETQGHAIEVADLVSTLVVEATVHLLDLGVDPPEAALAHTLDVLEQLHDGPLPEATDPVAAVLQATGREPSAHPAYPLLG